MKFKLLIIILLVNSMNLFSQIDKEANFEKFINKFPISEIPKDFSTIEYNSKIDSTDLRYICDYVNFCEDTYLKHTPEYYFCQRYEVSDSFYLVLYCFYHRQILKYHQYILATYSKKDQNIISKLLIKSYFPLYHIISSKIDENLNIEVKTLYSYETFPTKLDPNHPEYFWINEIIDMYRIDKFGEIKFDKRISDNKYVAKYGIDSNYYDYPVSLPND